MNVENYKVISICILKIDLTFAHFLYQCMKRVKAIWHEFVISSKWQQIWLQHSSNNGNNNNKDDGSYRAAILGATNGGRLGGLGAWLATFMCVVQPKE